MASRFRNYNRGKGYGGTSVACQTDAFQEKKYTNKVNKGGSSQEKDEYKKGVGASNKPKGDLRASIQGYVRSDPEVLEVFLEERKTLHCHLGKIMDRKCKAVVDSGAQVTVINKCFKECMRGESRPARLKGVAEDNSLMVELVDDVETKMEVPL